MNSARPELKVAVVMRRERVQGAMSRWQTWRWVLAEVVSQETSFGNEPRLLYKNEAEERWLHPGYVVTLFADDAEGYYLNVTTPAPAWFVLWRMEEASGVCDEPIAKPEAVSLSYHDAGRWLDAQETVEQVPAPMPVVQWLRAFVDEHRSVEAKVRRRPQSFRALPERFGNATLIAIPDQGARPVDGCPTVGRGVSGPDKECD